MDKTTDKKDYVTILKKDYDKLRKAYEKLGGIFDSSKSEKTLEESLEDTYGIWKDNPKSEEAIEDLRKEWTKWNPKKF